MIDCSKLLTEKDVYDMMGYHDPDYFRELANWKRLKLFMSFKDPGYFRDIREPRQTGKTTLKAAQAFAAVINGQKVAVICENNMSIRYFKRIFEKMEEIYNYKIPTSELYNFDKKRHNNIKYAMKHTRNMLISFSPDLQIFDVEE